MQKIKLKSIATIGLMLCLILSFGIVTALADTAELTDQTISGEFNLADYKSPASPVTLTLNDGASLLGGYLSNVQLKIAAGAKVTLSNVTLYGCNFTGVAAPTPTIIGEANSTLILKENSEINGVDRNKTAQTSAIGGDAISGVGTVISLNCTIKGGAWRAQNIGSSGTIQLENTTGKKGGRAVVNATTVVSYRSGVSRGSVWSRDVVTRTDPAVETSGDLTYYDRAGTITTAVTGTKTRLYMLTLENATSSTNSEIPDSGLLLYKQGDNISIKAGNLGGTWTTDPIGDASLASGDNPTFAMPNHDLKLTNKAAIVINERWTDEGNYDATLYAEQPGNWQISTTAHLAALAKKVNDGSDFSSFTITLTAPINLAGKDWAPIGTETHPFSGTFDSKGNAISNLTIGGDITTEVDTNNGYFGLFGYVKNGVLKNATLTDTSITPALVKPTDNYSKYYIGALAGKLEASVAENCHTAATIAVAGKMDGATPQELYHVYVGGLVGHNFLSTILNSSSAGMVEINTLPATSRYLGGIAGVSEALDISCILNSYTRCDLSVTDADIFSDYVGGIAGKVQGDNICNVYVVGTLPTGWDSVTYSNSRGTIEHTYVQTASTEADTATVLTDTEMKAPTSQSNALVDKLNATANIDAVKKILADTDNPCAKGQNLAPLPWVNGPDGYPIHKTATEEDAKEAKWTTDNGANWADGTFANGLSAMATATDASKCRIELQKDLSSVSAQITGGVFTLDLQGKTINLASTLYIDGATTGLTITDSSEQETGKISYSTSGSIAICIVNDAKLTLEKGTLENSQGSNVIISAAQTGLYEKGGLITINGGKVIHLKSDSGKDGNAIYSCGGFVMTGGSITSEAANPSLAIVEGEAKITGSNSSITNTGGASAIIIADPATAKIFGGSFTGSGADDNCYAIKNYSTLQLSGSPILSGTVAGIYTQDQATISANIDNQYYTGSKISIIYNSADQSNNDILIGGLKDEDQSKLFELANAQADVKMEYDANNKNLVLSQTAYDVAGKVTDNSSSPLAKAEVKLMQGNKQIGATQTTDDQGKYRFAQVPSGVYNVVATTADNSKTVTLLTNVVNSSLSNQNLVMPAAEVSSKLEIQTGAPDAVVGGLDTIAGKETPATGDKVTIQLTIKPDNTASEGAKAIKTAMGSQKTDGYLDFGLAKITQPATGDAKTDDLGSSNTTVLEIVIPYDFANKKDVAVYRYHGTTAEKLLALNAKPSTPGDKTFFADTDKGLIYIYASKFSTYAVGYTKNQTSSGGGSSSSKPEVKPEEKPETTPTAFDDVKTADWYYEAVKYVVDKKLMNGTSATLFSPLAATDRAMIATILYRLEDSPKVDKRASFTDVADNIWYTEAIAWAEANQIVKGYGNGQYLPNKSISREELAAILYRYTQYKKIEAPTEGMAIGNFEDNSKVQEWARPAIRWAIGQGLINGKTQTTLEPQGLALRAEVATLLQRYTTNILK